MEKMDKEKLEQIVIQQLKSISDIELPINIYELGLIYDTNVEIKEDCTVSVNITTTHIDSRKEDKYYFMDEIRKQIQSIEDIDECNIDFVETPKWDPSMIKPRALEKLRNAS